ncbi:MAG TPA: hypothetical protein EYQ30_00730 [Gammaproteobacteria bacterium]|nr:hypothetical protein [Gammaproteobacteria bacterium]HIL62235.1 hypothetical protein [Porticoccaceae bacterium]
MPGHNHKRQIASTRALALLLPKLITIVFAIVQGWNVVEVMWIYWWQSVIIGVFNYESQAIFHG